MPTRPMDLDDLTLSQKLQLIYRHTHKDFKGNNATFGKTIAIFRNGTILAPLKDLTAAEVDGLLPAAIRAERARLMAKVAKATKEHQQPLVSHLSE